MSLTQKSKRLNAANSDLIATEYAGIDSTGVYYPKSIRSLRGDELKFALRGMLMGWAVAKSSRGIIPREGVVLNDKSNPEFYEFLLYFWILKYNRQISSSLLPLFKDHEEREQFIKGQVDLVKFEIESEHCFDGFICKYSDLSFDFSYLRVLKDGYKEVLRRLNNNSESIKELFNVTCQGLELLKRVPHSVSPQKNANEIAATINDNGEIVSLPQKIEGLTEAIKFFTEFIASHSSGVSETDTRLPGVLFNLNYLFELILRRALRSTYADTSIQKALFSNDQINKITVTINNKKTGKRHMQPDCLGVFSKINKDIPERIAKFLEGKIYILDSKHKIFSDEDQVEAMSRSDFYQIVSYSTTHHRIDNREGVYGLVGLDLQENLISDRNFSSREYVSLGADTKCSLVEIESKAASVSLVQIPVKFGQFLYDLGKAEESDFDTIYNRLGKNILQALFEILSNTK